MSILQVGLNLLFAVLAFALASYLLSLVLFDGAFGFVIALVIGIGVFFANFASRVRA